MSAKACGPATGHTMPLPAFDGGGLGGTGAAAGEGDAAACGEFEAEPCEPLGSGADAVVDGLLDDAAEAFEAWSCFATAASWASLA